ncbi:MAG TPA: 30S ribosomal protein S6--L-glutamate ligase, partial [Algoriphagus sp.]|nr:30S ribosomal protein S6--L-glutamate ligase [Algoriphagus sp.]
MKIAILSRNPNLYSTKRLYQAIQAAGHEAMIVNHSICDLIIEQEGPSIIYKGEKLTGVDAIIPRVGASVTFYGTAVV